MGVKVKLRQKEISGKRKSLYLDYYPAIPHPETSKPTRREFLGLYLFDKPTNSIDKLHNKETLQIAQQIRQKRDSLVNKPEIYTEFEKEQLQLRKLGETNFVEYFKSLTNKRKGSTRENWNSAYHYLYEFCNGFKKCGELNEQFCNDFKDYLLNVKSRKSTKNNLSQNTASSYFSKFKASLKSAYKAGMLKIDLNSRIDLIPLKETKKYFLTIEEVNLLGKTQCENIILKKAVLFAALTGLRFSDIEKLIWGELEYVLKDGYQIIFEQRKTSGQELLPISEQAYKLLGDPKRPEDKVFDGLIYSSTLNNTLKDWVKSTGINKTITFHCFRHTYATLLLHHGVDIYTVSKMLGHRGLKNTLVYLHLLDNSKRNAADIIKLDL